MTIRHLSFNCPIGVPVSELAGCIDVGDSDSGLAYCLQRIHINLRRGKELKDLEVILKTLWKFRAQISNSFIVDEYDLLGPSTRRATSRHSRT